MASLFRRKNDIIRTLNFSKNIFFSNVNTKMLPKNCSTPLLNPVTSILMRNGLSFNRNLSLFTSQNLTKLNSQNILQTQCAVSLVPHRRIVIVSRLGKRKSVKSVRKRFFRVKGGYLKRWRAGKTHKMVKKNSWRRFRLKGSVLVKNKTQLKTLNKMLLK